MGSRDRHGRGLRRPVLPPSVPAHRTRAGQFDDAVAAVLERVDERWSRSVESVEIAVEMVAPSEPAPWEHGVPVTRIFPGERGQPTRIVVYRRPLERRADGDSLPHVIRDVVVDALAHVWRCRPEDIDPDYGT